METSNPVELWNNAVRSLLKAKEDWSTLQARVLEGIDLESLPIKAQKFLSLATVKASFEIAVVRLVEYYRVSGGLEELLIETPPEDNLEKEKKDAGRKTKRRL